MKNMTKHNETKVLNDIRKYARMFLKEEYNIDLNIPVELNGRLSLSLGRFTHTSKKAIKMDFSKNLVKYYDMEDIIGTIKHECIHYALFLKNKPFNDGDEYFEKELKKHGAPSTHTGAYHGKLHEYKCECSKHRQVRRMNVDRYHCGRCKSKYKYLGCVIV